MIRHRLLPAALVIGLLVVPAGPAAAADSDGDGVGNARDRCPQVPGDRNDGCPTARWRLRNPNTPGPASITFVFGSIQWRAVVGDWNGDGIDTVGTFDQASRTWRLRNTNGTGGGVLTFEWDVPAPGPHLPIAGDWDGDGDDTIGIYVPQTRLFALRNTNSDGPVDIPFEFGGPQPTALVRPVADDWDGDGDDTIGLFRLDTNRWRLRNTNSEGPADLLFTFGRPGSQELPLSGDWNGDGDVGIGVAIMEEEGIYYFLRQTPTPGTVETQFSWGVSECPGCPPRVVAGDWNGDGTDSTGFRR